MPCAVETISHTFLSQLHLTHALAMAGHALVPGCARAMLAEPESEGPLAHVLVEQSWPWNKAVGVRR